MKSKSKPCHVDFLKIRTIFLAYLEFVYDTVKLVIGKLPRHQIAWAERAQSARVLISICGSMEILSNDLSIHPCHRFNYLSSRDDNSYSDKRSVSAKSRL